MISSDDPVVKKVLLILLGREWVEGLYPLVRRTPGEAMRLPVTLLAHLLGLGMSTGILGNGFHRGNFLDR